MPSQNTSTKQYSVPHHYIQKHLLLENAPMDTQIKSGWEIVVDQVFSLGIEQFMEGIRDSVYRHGGHLDLFETTPQLQNNFEKAVEQIFQS